MSKVDIWMPIYIGDYLGDTQDLTAQEHGTYFLLLMHYWMKKGVIGSDIERLARVCRSNVETARLILGSYFTLENGNYKNKRADIEMYNAESRRQSATENGKKGGRPPKNNPQETYRKPVGIPDGNRARNPQESSSSSSSSSYSSLHSTPEKEESIFSREEALNPNTQNSEQRFQQLKTAWNTNCKPSCNIKSTITMNYAQRDDWTAGESQIVDIFATCKAIQNYGGIQSSAEYELDNHSGYSMLSFLVKGVEWYTDEARPFERCRKKQSGPHIQTDAERKALIDKAFEEIENERKRNGR